MFFLHRYNPGLIVSVLVNIPVGRIHDRVFPIAPSDQRAGSRHRLAGRVRRASRSHDLWLCDPEAVDPEFSSSPPPLTR
jgi:hypothetical protein